MYVCAHHYKRDRCNFLLKGNYPIDFEVFCIQIQFPKVYPPTEAVLSNTINAQNTPDMYRRLLDNTHTHSLRSIPSGQCTHTHSSSINTHVKLIITTQHRATRTKRKKKRKETSLASELASQCVLKKLSNVKCVPTSLFCQSYVGNLPGITSEGGLPV